MFWFIVVISRQELKLLSEIEPGDAPPTEEQIQKMVEQDREDAENGL